LRRAWRWIKQRKFALGVAALIIVLVAAGALLQVSVDHAASNESGVGKSAPANAGQSILDVLGGVRESLAAYFWTKTDEIFHGYLGGSLYQEKPLFPYYWMITRLDPHFVMPFYFASWMLCEYGHPAEGLKLALEGARYNPDSADMQEDLAEIYLFFMNDPQKAAYHSHKAMTMATSEEQLRPYQEVQKVIDLVLSGQRKITKPPLKLLQQLRDSDKH